MEQDISFLYLFPREINNIILKEALFPFTKYFWHQVFPLLFVSKYWLKTIPSYFTYIHTSTYDNGITDTSIARLLHFLDMKYCQIDARTFSRQRPPISSLLTDQKFHMISQLTGLQTLLINLSGPAVITAQSMYALSSLTNLKYLYIDDWECSSKGTKWGLPLLKLTNLQSLTIKTKLNTDVFYSCYKLRNLTYLHLNWIADSEDHDIDPEGSPIDYIQFCTGLQCLELKDDREEDYIGDLEVIWRLTTLTRLALQSEVATELKLYVHWTTLTNLKDLEYDVHNSTELQTKIENTFNFLPPGTVKSIQPGTFWDVLLALSN